MYCKLTLTIFTFIFINFVAFAQCPLGNVELNNQQAVNDFAAMYPNCTEIDGYLQIGTLDTSNDISDISVLGQITDVIGKLSVLHTLLTNLNVLENTDFSSLNLLENDLLEGLPNWQHISSLGELEISGNDQLVNIEGLEGLTSASTLYIRNNSQLNSIEGLSNIMYVGISLEITKNESLTSLNGLNNLVANDYIFFGGITIRENHALTSLEGLESLGGSVFSFNIIQNNNLLNINGLGSIGLLNTMTITDNPNLSNIEGLSDISFQALHLENNPMLSVCHVQSVCDHLAEGGYATIENNASGCNTQVEVQDNCELVSACPQGDITLTTQQDVNDFMAQYPNCTEINDNLTIGDFNIDSDINNLAGLANITTITGDLMILDNDSLTTLTELNNLDSIGGNLAINYNDNLPTLEGLENLSSLEGRLRIERNNNLTSLIGIEDLSSVGGAVDIVGNEILPNLTGLENLQTVGTFLNIIVNPVLNQLTGLNDSLDVPDIDIKDNYQLSTCDHPAICRHIMLGRPIHVEDNLPGCNSIAALEADCIVAIEVPSDANFAITPNPNTGIFQVNGIAKGTYQIHDTAGRIIQSGNMENNLSIDISTEAQGVYFMSIQMENEVICKRIVKM